MPGLRALFCPERRVRAAHDGRRVLRTPYPPQCVSNPASYGSQAEIDKCQEDVNRYVNSVAAYRLCHTEEIERAVRATNGTLQHWQCGVAAKAICP